MSILIKGMKNPTDCWFCPLMSHMLCGYNKGEIPESGKREDCPLEEIPTPHGRLIDADKVVKKLAKAVPWHIDKSNSIYVDRLVKADKIIENAPTLIESED